MEPFKIILNGISVVHFLSERKGRLTGFGCRLVQNGTDRLGTAQNCIEYDTKHNGITVKKGYLTPISRLSKNHY